MERYVIIHDTELGGFQRQMNAVAQKGYVLHSYKHQVFDIPRIQTEHHYSAVMELEAVELDMAAFQQQYIAQQN